MYVVCARCLFDSCMYVLLLYEAHAHSFCIKSLSERSTNDDAAALRILRLFFSSCQTAIRYELSLTTPSGSGAEGGEDGAERQDQLPLLSTLSLVGGLTTHHKSILPRAVIRHLPCLHGGAGARSAVQRQIPRLPCFVPMAMMVANGVRAFNFADNKLLRMAAC